MFPAFVDTVSMPSHPRRSLPWLRGDRGAVLLLVLIFVLLNLPLLVGQVAEHWDGEYLIAPLYHYTASLIRAGMLMRWNPFTSGGSPDFADPDFGASSPITLLFGLLAGPGPLGFHLYWLCMWLFGGLGMYVLARALSAPPWGALVSALSLVLCGFYLGHGEHFSFVYPFSFVPWILWRVRAAMLAGRWLPACEAGALFGLAALAGSPAVEFPAALFIGVIAPAFVLPLPPDSAARWRAARSYVITMVLLAVVGMVVLLPGYGSFLHEVTGYSHRTQPLPRETVLEQGYGFSWLTALFTPSFVLDLKGIPAWAEYDVSMRLVYCGAPVLVLAGFAAWRRRAWQEWAILAVGLLCLGMAMGTTLPLRGWLYDFVPPTRFIRHPAVFRGFFVLTLTMLAAFGTARIEAARRTGDVNRRLRPLAVAAGIGALLGTAAYFWVSFLATDSVLAHVPASTPWHVAFAWVGMLLVCLAARKTEFRRFLPGALVALTTMDLAVAFQYSSEITFAAKPSMVTQGPVGPIDDLGAAGWNRAAASPGNRNLYSHRPTFVNYTAMRNLIQEYLGAWPVMRQFICGPQRVWFAAGVPVVPPTEKAYEAFRQRALVLKDLPIVRHERASFLRPDPASPDPTPEVLAAIAAAPAAQPVVTEVLSYHANDLALRITAPADGFVLVTERWSRSWETTVNGQPVTTDGGDFVFRLVPVRAGENVIAMHYQVVWWYVLIALSWTTMAAVAAASLWHHFRRRQVSPAPPVSIRPARVEPASVAVA